MKKIVYLIIIGLLVFSCKEKDSETKSLKCALPPMSLWFLINNKSEMYKDFFDKEGSIYDKVGVYDNQGNKIKTLFKHSKDKYEIKKGYSFFNIHYKNISFLTGKEETIYIKNRGKDIIIKINGIIKHNSCGETSVIKKVIIDGINKKEGEEFGDGNKPFIYLTPKQVKVEVEKDKER